MKVLLTGADGFLGWHTRVRLRALTDHEVVCVTRENWSEISKLAVDADAIIHCAGVNRAPSSEVERGNLCLARAVARAVRESPKNPCVIYANSIQAGNDTPYGRGKSIAGEILFAEAQETGAKYRDVRLPNLFGEHCKPRYNSFVATFVDDIANGRTSTVRDSPVSLLHVQRAAEILISGLTVNEHVVVTPSVETSVVHTYDLLKSYGAAYNCGDIPELKSDFHLDLFNTLRSAKFPDSYPIHPKLRTDSRGALAEVIRVHGGTGQTFVSTTKPGVVRGEHFHLRKIERFVVLSGQARISLRRVLTDEIVTFDVDGDAIAIIDMPTMWTHNIQNIGRRELITLFWTNDLFSAESPDTFADQVSTEGRSSA